MKHLSLNCRGKLLSLDTPKIMGIVNLTENSFYDGGKYLQVDDAEKYVDELVNINTDIIDFGACSTKPGASLLPLEEEWNRLAPMISYTLATYPQQLISVDTFRPTIAKRCLDMGVHIINDVNIGETTENMLQTVGEYDAPYIHMHNRGTPATMSQLTDYNNLLTDVIYYFSKMKAQAVKYGINDFIIDPGIGFAKNIEQNFELIQHLHLFQSLESPILIGLSRKSFIYKTLNILPLEALNGTTAMHMVALQNGANIIRVHDVKEAQQCITLFNRLQNA